MASWERQFNNFPPEANNLIDHRQYYMNQFGQPVTSPAMPPTQYYPMDQPQPGNYPAVPQGTSNPILGQQFPMNNQPGTYGAMPSTQHYPMGQQPNCHFTQAGGYPAMPQGTSNPILGQQFPMNNQPGTYGAMPPTQHYPMGQQPNCHFTQAGGYPAMPQGTSNPILGQQFPMNNQPGTYGAIPPTPHYLMGQQPNCHSTLLGDYPAMAQGTNNPISGQQLSMNNQQALGNSTQPENYQTIPSSTQQTTNHPTAVNSLKTMISTHIPQPLQQVTNSTPGQTPMQPGNNQQLTSFKDYCVSSVSHNFLLKFVLQECHLSCLRNGQSFTLNFLSVNPFQLEIDPDCQLIFKQSNYWESFDLVYAFVESKEKAFRLEESSQLSFLTPFQPTSVDDKDVIIHCKVIAYPRYSTVANYQNIGQVQLPTVLPSSGVLPTNYKNEKVINFIRKGIIPKFDVDMAIEIIRESKTHKCNVLTILCIEYLMKNTVKDDLQKISEVARENHLMLLQEKCLIDFENLTIKAEKKDESEETKVTKKEKNTKTKKK